MVKLVNFDGFFAYKARYVEKTQNTPGDFPPKITTGVLSCISLSKAQILKGKKLLKAKTTTRNI